MIKIFVEGNVKMVFGRDLSGIGKIKITKKKRLSSNRGTELFSIQHMKVITINEDQVSYAY